MVEPVKNGKIQDGSDGIGYYQGLGAELAVEVQNGSSTTGMVGFGVGAGGHLGRGTQSVGGEVLQGAVSGVKTGSLVETNPIQSGEVRVGPSVSGSIGIGTVGLDIGYGVGASTNNQDVSGYQNFSITPTFSPVIPKIAAEVKVNVIEFTVKSTNGGGE